MQMDTVTFISNKMQHILMFSHITDNYVKMDFKRGQKKEKKMRMLK